MTSTKLTSKLFGLAGAGMAAALLAGSSAQAANLVTNGSFEDLTHSNSTAAQEIGVGDNSTMPGWTVITDDITWVGPDNSCALTASPGGGDYFLDLSGFHNGAPDGGLQQTISTTAGASYTLTFALGSSSLYGLPDGVHVTAGDGSKDFVSANNGTTPNFWETETLAFKATGATTTITFQGNAGVNYVGLDDVSVTGGATSGTPEPAAWALMLVGFGGLGAMLRRRRGLALTA